MVEVMAAFEEMNEVVITLTGRVVRVAGLHSLILEFQAHDAKVEIGEAPSLALQRCSIGSTDHLRMESAVMWALYQLDGQMARNEMVKKPKAE